MEALTTFGSNFPIFKSDYNLSEHGIGFKFNALRLANTVLIISKTKPITDLGTYT